MKPLRLLATIVVAGALAAMTTAVASASTPPPLQIVSTGSQLDRSTIHPGPGLGTAEATLTGGTFDAAGAIEASGQVTIDVMFSGAAPDSDVVHGSAGFTTATSSLTLQFQALHLPFDSPVFDGEWTLSDATGAYTGLHGAGTVEFDITGETTSTPIIDATWSGLVH
jgi:hypothetical protein